MLCYVQTEVLLRGVVNSLSTSTKQNISFLSMAFSYMQFAVTTLTQVGCHRTIPNLAAQPCAF